MGVGVCGVVVVERVHWRSVGFLLLCFVALLALRRLELTLSNSASTPTSLTHTQHTTHCAPALSQTAPPFPFPGEAGCDRTGEIYAGYVMRYHNASFQAVDAFDKSICRLTKTTVRGWWACGEV